ncbi:helix-turn-helix transcriptional regulator [Priestia megaterium]|uniref:helix-turn-helix domain-containing protein n=1 Tax=Priestia megaterium TaxID=1404 RepID=UPI002E1BCFF0|nr:helix-turn-helix transcriptional regulator [Priestia megaterium]
MKDTKNIFGERIKARKEELKLRDEDIANLVGVSRSSVTGWISGHRIPGNKRLTLLADALNTSMEYLTGKTDNPLPIHGTIKLKDMLLNGDIVYDGEVITDDQKKMFLEILDTIMKSKLK